MRRPSNIRRFVGMLFILTAILGILFSAAGIIAIWTLRPRVTASLLENVRGAHAAVNATSQGLDAVNQSLKTAGTSVDALQETVNTTARTLEDSKPLLDTLITLTKEDLPKTIASTKTSLASAQESAQVIDRVLSAITSLPFVSKDLYNPPVPLHIALGQIATSLDRLPDSFDTMQRSLSSARANVTAIQANMNAIAKNIGAVKSSVQDAQKATGQYQELIGALQGRFDRLEAAIPGQVNLAAALLTFLLAWAGIAQLGLLIQGLDLASTSNLNSGETH